MRKNDRNREKTFLWSCGKGLFALVVMLMLWQMPLQAKAQDVYRNTNEYRAIIEDKKGALSETEIEKLTEVMKPITEYAHIALIIENKPARGGYFYAQDYAETQWGPHSKGIVVLVDMRYEPLYMHTTGTIGEIITTGRNEALAEEFEKYSISGEYYTCALKTLEQLGAILSEQKIVTPMKYIGYLLLALITSMIIMYHVVNQSMKKHVSEEMDWLEGVAVKQDIYNFSEHYLHETKKYVPGSSKWSDF